jgi:hypothetical protein
LLIKFIHRLELRCCLYSFRDLILVDFATVHGDSPVESESNDDQSEDKDNAD